MTTQPPTKTSMMANAIRALSMDAVQQANSGHPGMPMGMAEIAVALWQRHLRHNPVNPHWVDRDRFVLSNGHGSMLLYALLHLSGYDLPMDELKRFRQLHSRTPGHPEVGITPGVETTTGPLGQGLANAVGMALAEALLAAEFNQPDVKIVNHYTYVFVGDGCLMEGISHEACSLAGTLGLSKLIVLYDDNGISIDGEVKHWFADDTPKRFEAYGWNVIRSVDGHDVEEIDTVIRIAKKSNKPTLICCRTVIGRGAPNKAGSHGVHGAPLGDIEIAAARLAIGWDTESFVIPPDVYTLWNAKNAGAKAECEWNRSFAVYRSKYPKQSAEFERRIAGRLPAHWADAAQQLIADVNERAEAVATRKASQQAIEVLASALPELLGGSADLASSTLTYWKASKAVRARCESNLKLLEWGNHVNYGVREFCMSAAINGIALHGGYLPFGSTFLIFSDYSRNALRMASMMRTRSIFVFTHDSIGLGEDGPTHQSIEHISCLRLIPNMEVWRPADSVETAVAWTQAVERHGPSSLIFSRQNLTFFPRTHDQIASVARGGYVLHDWNNDIMARKVLLISTGSEVELAMNSVKPLARLGISTRVVSMPSSTVFDRQETEWREHVLPRGVARVAIEAGVTAFWHKYVGIEGGVIGINTFGESAPAGVLFKNFGFTIDNIIKTVKSVLD
ncbi:transketolase [Candidatus Vallotia lariciata]|uniref:transketolase n=1 Tax=Candidatus Vallotia laricis TaxID=2018052 RepID=UPI001D025069|nr:transketolase [Candidatus Vallotia lariciata]UDG82829.1 Transketolase 1 [Candidatus Vallotia lariciata]